jgi:CRP-like cAMP-binding protein
VNLQNFSQIELFKSLSTPELESIYQVGRDCQLKQGLYFFLQGDPADTMYVLMRGQVKMTQIAPDGQQVLIRLVVPREEFAAVAVLSGFTYSLSAQAVEDCVTLAWNKETITHLFSAYPRLSLNVLHLLAERFKELQERYRELATERVEQRLASALLRLERQAGCGVNGGVLINLYLSRQDLAELTGTTHYTVSRILSQWEQQGLVETGRARVVILNSQALSVVAEDFSPEGAAPV